MLRFRGKVEAAVKTLTPAERDSVLVDAILAMSRRAHEIAMTDEELRTPELSVTAYKKLNEAMCAAGCPGWFGTPNAVRVYQDVGDR
jgi:hypothetical protein